MSRLQTGFLKSDSGSFLPIFAVSLVPLLLALGLSVDYSMATSTKSSMQSALDAATLSVVTLPKTATDTDRQKALQAAFLANGGQGTVTLNTFTVAADGTVDVKATAGYQMPTHFMQIAMIKDVPIAVRSSVNKTPALVEATFKIDKVSGYWGKTMTLFGTKFTESTAKKLMEIKYTYNGAGGLKGFGTTTVSKLDDAGKRTVLQTQT
jgi:Flp pilus assembly protein TadG